MDEDKSKDNAAVENLTHTVESGFVDIKPLQAISAPFKEWAFNFLIVAGVLVFSYIIFKILKSKKRSKTSKKEISPIVLFNKRISEIKTGDPDFRNFCESLAYALKNLLSAIFKDNYVSLTPYYLRLELVKKAATTLSLSPSDAETFAYQIEGLVKKLEGGEYGDTLTVSQLENLKDSLLEETKNLGIKLVGHAEHAGREKKYGHKKNVR